VADATTVGGDDVTEIWGRNQRQRLVGSSGDKAEFFFAKMTVNFACNLAHACSEYAES